MDIKNNDKVKGIQCQTILHFNFLTVTKFECSELLGVSIYMHSQL